MSEGQQRLKLFAIKNVKIGPGVALRRAGTWEFAVITPRALRERIESEPLTASQILLVED